MITEWKLRQELSHKLYPIDDELVPAEIELVTDPARRLELCVEYFSSPQEKLYYPCKSYCVAIIYARLLSENFGMGFLEALDDPGLLFGNDPYFVPYSKDPALYDAILARTSGVLDLRLRQVSKTVEYFRREFLIGGEHECRLPRV